MSKSLLAASIACAMALVFITGCHDDEAKKTRALEEIGIQAGVLMKTTDVPRDQKEYDKMTYSAGCPADPWGHPYVYERLGIRKIRISSTGRDAKLGTPDDVAQEFTFPTGAGLDDLTVTLADGTKAIRSPDGAHTFWTTTKVENDDQTVDYFLGDAKAAAAKPFKSEKLNGDWRRSVTLNRWTKDGHFVELKDVVMPSRPDGSDDKESTLVVSVADGKIVEPSNVPADASWVEY